MFSIKSGPMFQESAERDGSPQVPLHNVDVEIRPSGPVEASQDGPSEHLATQDGTWGERDIGGPVNFLDAMQEFEDLRNELSHLSKTRTQRTEEGRRHTSLGLRKTNTNASRPRTATGTGPDLEAQGNEIDVRGQDKEFEAEKENDDFDSEDFELGDFLREGHFEKRDAGKSAKKIGVIYKNLTVQGVGATAVFVKTLPAAVIGVSITFVIFMSSSIRSALGSVKADTMGVFNFQMKLSGSEKYFSFGRQVCQSIICHPFICSKIIVRDR
jgi:ATP-binding cassette, subfamily G (WHITE), member 2, SNQ2